MLKNKKCLISYCRTSNAIPSQNLLVLKNCQTVNTRWWISYVLFDV